MSISHDFLKSKVMQGKFFFFLFKYTDKFQRNDLS